jgi:hypothetical protein
LMEVARVPSEPQIAIATVQLRSGVEVLRVVLFRKDGASTYNELV